LLLLDLLLDGFVELEHLLELFRLGHGFGEFGLLVELGHEAVQDA